MKHTLVLGLALIAFLSILPGCKKLVAIDPPINTITTSQVFADSADAEAALEGLYTNMINVNSYTLSFCNGALSVYCGASADELIPFSPADDGPFFTNTLTATNGIIYTKIWYSAFQFLYQANAIIESAAASTGLSDAAKNGFIGEAKFWRALYDFYLVNLFQNIPLVTTTNYNTTENIRQSDSSEVYKSIIADLVDAIKILPADYSAGNGERVRANKWAAIALLARVYLYNKDWKDAEAQASLVINEPKFQLTSDLDSTFLANSTETILQLRINAAQNSNTYNATPEGNFLIPYDNTSPPNYYLTTSILSSFASNDLRRSHWIDSTNYSGVNYFYPSKYNIGPAAEMPNMPATQYFTVLRMAEQYLVRAEAKLQGDGDISGAMADLNILRLRAGIDPLDPSQSAGDAATLIEEERKRELFTEWGHRWLDLKRTGQVQSILSAAKPAWQAFQKLYPIPAHELLTDPNLHQNPGYQ